MCLPTECNTTETACAYIYIQYRVEMETVCAVLQQSKAVWVLTQYSLVATTYTVS